MRQKTAREVPGSAGGVICQGAASGDSSRGWGRGTRGELGWRQALERQQPAKQSPSVRGRGMGRHSGIGEQDSTPGWCCVMGPGAGQPGFESRLCCLIVLCVTLEKLFKLSELQFPSLPTGVLNLTRLLHKTGYLSCRVALEGRVLQKRKRLGGQRTCPGLTWGH